MLRLFPGLSGGSGAQRDSRGHACSPLFSQTPGMPIPQYPYGDSSPGVSAQGPPPQPRPPEDTWAPPTVYGVQPRYTWPAASVHGNPFVSESHPPWTGSGASSHPPVWDSQVQFMLLQRVLPSDLLDYMAFLKTCLCLLGMPLSPSIASLGRNKAAGIQSTASKISYLHTEDQSPRL